MILLWKVPEAGVLEIRMEEEESSDEECPPVSSKETLRPRVVRHSKAQINYLNYYYEMGMRGCSREEAVLIEKAASDTQLSIEQVKVRHDDYNYRWCQGFMCFCRDGLRKKTIGAIMLNLSSDTNLPPLKKRKRSLWHAFQKEYGECDGMFGTV